ncbi:RsfA family transcriptional regulator [Fredinandcohnia quinoae]|uniref:RsfA family transcriptional regulator n=1 Tax=Fredinandcohnia quinoae TaxID=2918902 RepID=A0AAW5E580_9BACI|nr:RsfA family transcriptional regulator [Fredinandcohnia sp. SECRCQ15]MCH1627668.1 RsfA family transcriptional regulator [Fredinandcohnia sp. SECRCQ15]
MKVRQDAWSHEDDLLLAETVLRYIREGGTQLAAFEEVGDKLNRTSAACGFRWNAEVRNNYDQAIAIAKKQRKERKRALERSNKVDVITNSSQETKSIILPEATTTVIEEFSTELLPTTKSITLTDCISFLTNLRKEDMLSNQIEHENNRLRRENDALLQQNKELEKRLEKLANQQTMIQEDYQALVQIMDRARRMVMFEDNEELSAPAFRMDKNGNLEQVAK